MKAALVLFACLAVASAVNFDTQSNPFCAYSFNSVCQSLNGTCDTVIGTSSITTYDCASGTYEKTESGKCYCRGYTFQAPTLGATCNPGETAANGYVCTMKNAALQNGDTTYYWFSNKLQGDTCTSAFDCSPLGTARQCANGKCYGRLFTGAVCSNGTTFLSSACSIQDYCQVTSGTGICTPRLAPGADCTTDKASSPCPSYQACLAADGYSTTGSPLTCQTPNFYWIAGGIMANASTQCATGTWNATSKICYSRDDQMTIYNAGKVADCSASTDCTAYGTCGCTSQGSSTSTACSFSATTQATLQSTRNAALVKAKAFYDAGCEWFTYSPISGSPYAGVSQSANAMPANNNAYCVVRLSYYAADYTCGAFQNMGMSSITVALGVIFATLLAKW